MRFPSSIFVQKGLYGNVRKIGQGGFAIVYSARDNRLNRTVAVKEPLTHATSTISAPSATERFLREARLHASLDNNKHVVKVLTLLGNDSQSREIYLVCEYMEGGSVQDHLTARKAVKPEEAVKIALAVCDVLKDTHSKRIVHCDIKPGNILFQTSDGPRGTIKLGDFGIALSPTEPATRMPGYPYPGTPGFRPPEQFDMANDLDVRSDIYALGVTIWVMLTNSWPTDRVAPDTAGITNRQLAQIIQRATAPEARHRYQTPEAMAVALRALDDTSRLDQRWAELLALAVGGVLAFLVNIRGLLPLPLLIAVFLLAPIMAFSLSRLFKRRRLLWMIATMIGLHLGTGAAYTYSPELAFYLMYFNVWANSLLAATNILYYLWR